MTIKDTIRDDLKTAMKARDTETTGTLRMILAAFQVEEVSGVAHELTDADILKILAREVKKRGEAADVYQANGREDLAAKEKAEAEIIGRYLPAQLSDDEVQKVAADAVAQFAAESGEQPGMRQMGQVMAIATKLADGAADGKRLSAAVKAQLG